MPVKRRPNNPPDQLRVLVEIYIEMQPEDTPAQWEAALKEDFLPQLPGIVSVLHTSILRPCAECGAWFAATGVSRKDKCYHSDGCRSRAFRRRQIKDERGPWTETDKELRQ